LKGFFVLVLIGIVMGNITSQASRTKVKKVSNGVRFPVVRFVLAIYQACLIMGVGFIFAGYHDPREGVVIVGGVLFVLLSILTWPKAVEISATGLRQRTWRGVWKTIDWRDIVNTEERKDRSIVVRTKICKITHSSCHADRSLFLQKLKEHHAGGSDAH
jgi:hypothetical protein